MSDSIKIFNEKLIRCHYCPRLVAFRETVPLPPSLNNDNCWRKPVPGFGDENAWLLILGLAPSSQGGNRTGRIFTGDKSAVFLINALYQTGFANQSTSLHKEDGLKLIGCYMTAAVKCVPPLHKPTREEFKRCIENYLFQEIALLKNLKAVLVLGKVAFDAYFDWAKSRGFSNKKPKFSFGKSYLFPNLPTLYASYHPSPQNTNTGVLTEEMFINLLKKIIQEVNH